MSQTILSIDVSKSNSYATAFISQGNLFKKPILFNNSITGMNSALKLLKNLKTICKVKTDPIDAHRIAHVYYSNDIKSTPQIPEHTIQLRNLCRQYDRFTKSYCSMKLSFSSIIDLLFPKFDTVFTNICCKTALNVISNFPTPESILSADKNKLDKLMAAARESLSFKVAQQSNIQILGHYTKMLLTYQEILAKLRAQINKTARLSSAWPLYQATKAATRKYKGKSNNLTLYNYYTKKVSQGKHTKVARIATCSRLLRIIYDMWKNKEPFKVK